MAVTMLKIIIIFFNFCSIIVAPILPPVGANPHPAQPPSPTLKGFQDF